MGIEKKTSKINTWKPKPYQMIVERDGKLFVCHFDRIFGFADRVTPYNRFLIGKESYINQLDTITSYINFFINNYDYENELVTAYLKAKFALDKQKIFTAENMDSYISFLYEVIFTDTMVEKIVRMVEENYLDDIEASVDDKKKYVKNEKKHLESLEFTNQHIKILLAISFGMKMMSPCLFHYIQLNNIKIEKDSDIIFRFYKRLFDLFGFSDKYELRNDKDELVMKDITEEEMQDIIFNSGLVPVKVDTEVRYNFVDGEGVPHYYTRMKINMYNKLYVYVDFCVQTLYELSKTPLIAGNSC